MKNIKKKTTQAEVTFVDSPCGSQLKQANSNNMTALHNYGSL